MKETLREWSFALYLLPILLTLAGCGQSGCGPTSTSSTTCGSGTIGQKQSDGSCVCVPNQNGQSSNCGT